MKLKGECVIMAELRMKLTDVDQAILSSYKNFAEGLSDYLGEGFEIALHSLEDLDRSVIKIINGYHTGRSEGAPITDLALNMLNRIKHNNICPYISYCTENSKGEPMRSSTIAVTGEGGRIIGLMCINFYLNTPLLDVIKTLISSDTNNNEALSESFANNIGDMLQKTVEDVRQMVMADQTIPVSRKKRAIISELNSRGVFNLKDSVLRTAELLHISRNTIYLYIREAEEAGSDGAEE